MLKQCLALFLLLLVGCVKAASEDCANNLDDDNDGDTDCFDSECRGQGPCQFEDCQNDLDDDGDGATDCQDLACVQQPFCRPEANCNDNQDDDSDGDVDCDDVDCAFNDLCRPEFLCDDNLDNDQDGAADCADSDCDSSCVEDCSDGQDNDQDAAIDCQDPDCVNDIACSGDSIGAPCTADPECDGDVCLEEAVDGFPSGYCSQDCVLAQGVCNSSGDGLCIDVSFGTGLGLCLDACQVAASNCSTGYACVDVSNGQGQGVCFPACTDDAQCPATDICNPDNGFCATVQEDCQNGVDDDDDQVVECADLGCAQQPACDNFEDCFDNIDNNGDGAVDCADAGCALACANGCLAPVNPSVPSAQNHNTAGHANVSDGSCQLNPISGPPGGGGGDVVYRVVSNQSGILDLSLTSPAADLGLFVQTACGNLASEIGCSDIFLAGGTETLQVDILAGQPLFVFVGGFSAAEQGAYVLNIAVSGGAPEVCSDTVDNDQDGAIDCNDPNCAAACANGCADPDNLSLSTLGNSQNHGNVSDGSCQLAFGGGGGGDVVYRAVTASAGTLTLTMQSNADLGIFLQEFCGDAASEFACADDFIAGGTEQVQVSLPANQEFFIFVGGFNGAQAGPYILQVN
jgi:hypothetical protein